MNNKMKRKNYQNLTNETIMSALNMHKDDLNRFKVKEIGLFGSFAMGKQKKNSDIDFVAEFEEPTFDNFMDLVLFLEDLFKRKVDVLTPEGVRSIRIKSIAQNIKRSVIYA